MFCLHQSDWFPASRSLQGPAALTEVQLTMQVVPVYLQLGWQSLSRCSLPVILSFAVGITGALYSLCRWPLQQGP